jgi:hypothetical protein
MFAEHLFSADLLGVITEYNVIHVNPVTDTFTCYLKGTEATYLATRETVCKKSNRIRHSHHSLDLQVLEHRLDACTPEH